MLLSYFDSRLLIKTFVILIAIFFIADTEAKGRSGVQSMSIVPGSYHIPSNRISSSGLSVPAFCLNMAKNLPRSNDTFSIFEPGSKQILVHLGDDTFRLSEAIQKKLIRIRGLNDEELKEWKNNGLALRIENLDPKNREMYLEVLSLLPISTEKPDHKLLSNSDQNIINSIKTNQEDRQLAFWAMEELRKQEHGSSNGQEIEYHTAISKYQNLSKIPGDGNLNDETIKTLILSSSLRNFDATSDGEYRTFYIERQEQPLEKGYYRIISTGSTPKHVDKSDEIVEEINKVIGNSKNTIPYIFIGGPFLERDFSTLKISLKNKAEKINAKTIVLSDKNLQLFNKIQGNVSVIPLHNVALKKGDFYHKKVEIKGENESIIISLRSKKPSLIERFIAILQALFSKANNYTNISYLALVYKAKNQLASDMGISRKELDKEFKININNFDIAELSKLHLIAVRACLHGLLVLKGGSSDGAGLRYSLLIA